MTNGNNSHHCLGLTRRGAARRARAVLVLGAALCAVSCLQTHLERTLKRPEEIHTLDQRSAYLKVHMTDGRLYLLSHWNVDDIAQQIAGEGEVFSIKRERMGAGAFVVSIGEVALLETNVVQRSPRAAALAVITGISTAVTMFCIANPKACFGSCPTFYVSTDTDALIQAEGFSSSIAPSLEARDVDALYRVHADGPDFVLTMKNEALETHVVRDVALLVAKRPPGGRVLATLGGEFREGTDARAVDVCRAEEGDCRAKVQAFDGAERFSATDNHDLARREDIELQVPADGVPRGLVIASRQTLASTYLFYQSLAWLGRTASDTLAALERHDATVGRALTTIRDAVGGIEVLAETTDGIWATAGEVREMGPLASDIVLVPLPDNRTGRIRLRMARGHWRIDYLSVVRVGRRVEPRRIEPQSVTNAQHVEQRGHPLTTLPGDVYTYRFHLPADAAGDELFLVSQGYYLEWMREEWLAEQNPARAAQLLLNPEQLMRDVAPEFKKQEARMEKLFWGSRYVRH